MVGTQIDDFLPLRSVEIDILLSVAREPRHGYGILQDAEGRGRGGAGFEVPTLYRGLRRLRKAGLIEPSEAPDGEDDDSRREYWLATALGRRVLAAEIARLEVLVAEGRSLAPGGPG